MTDITQTTVARAATPEDIPAIAGAMARGFFDDPVVGQWCAADEARRMRRLEGVFALFMRRLYLRHGACYTDDDRAGGALWLPPDTWKLSAPAQLRLTVQMAPIAGRALPRILQVLSFLEARHPHEPHWYLPLIAVEPDRQGQGIGSALLRPVLDRCARDGLPAYLEASQERNVALYERHGFAVVEMLRLPGGGPPVWRMWREP